MGGMQAAIVGAPNAGKSSLVNALAGRKVAAVSAKTNTTSAARLAAFTEGSTQVLLCRTWWPTAPLCCCACPSCTALRSTNQLCTEQHVTHISSRRGRTAVPEKNRAWNTGAVGSVQPAMLQRMCGRTDGVR